MNTITKFPTLYHLNKDGSTQEWTISVSGRAITKTYGRKGGALHSVEDVIRSGKNKGRANETTAEEQAEAEAEAAWKRKQKEGYHQSLSSAQGGKVDSKFVKGGVEPMLAKKWEDYSDKVEYPVFVQPKLDGIRCIAVVENGKCTLWTRKRKPILSVPHIVDQIERWAKDTQTNSIVFDGELYNHSYKNDFEKIVSAVRKNKPSDLSAEIEYHIYDCIDSTTFIQRTMVIPTVLRESGSSHMNRTHLRNVHSYLCKNEKEVMQRYNQCLREGYEGAMVRAANGLYENRRSSNLLKMKDFDDAEFKIVGVEEGRGAFKGCAIFQCEAKELKPFSCKMRGSVDLLKSIFKDKSKVIGKKITVRYQGVTNGGVPRFPVGIAIRDYE